MTTALSLIKDALQEIGVIDESETPNDEDSAKGLRTMNDLLDAWSLENLTVYVQNNYTYTLIPGQAVYTIGTAGNFAGPRLTGINGAFTTYQTVDFPIQIIDDQTYNDIPLKTQAGIIVQALNYDATMPLSRVTLWPVPSQAIPITLLANQLFTTPVTLSTDLGFPPGYNRAFIKSLAVELCPAYGKEASPTLVRLMVSAMKTIKRQNKRTPVLRYDPALSDDRVNGVWNWIFM